MQKEQRTIKTSAFQRRAYGASFSDLAELLRPDGGLTDALVNDMTLALYEKGDTTFNPKTHVGSMHYSAEYWTELQENPLKVADEWHRSVDKVFMPLKHRTEWYFLYVDRTRRTLYLYTPQEGHDEGAERETITSSVMDTLQRHFQLQNFSRGAILIRNDPEALAVGTRLSVREQSVKLFRFLSMVDCMHMEASHRFEEATELTPARITINPARLELTRGYIFTTLFDGLLKYHASDHPYSTLAGLLADFETRVPILVLLLSQQAIQSYNLAYIEVCRRVAIGVNIIVGDLIERMTRALELDDHNKRFLALVDLFGSMERVLDGQTLKPIYMRHHLFSVTNEFIRRRRESEVRRAHYWYHEVVPARDKLLLLGMEQQRKITVVYNGESTTITKTIKRPEARYIRIAEVLKDKVGFFNEDARLNHTETRIFDLLQLGETGDNKAGDRQLLTNNLVKDMVSLLIPDPSKEAVDLTAFVMMRPLFWSYVRRSHLPGPMKKTLIQALNHSTMVSMPIYVTDLDAWFLAVLTTRRDPVNKHAHLYLTVYIDEYHTEATVSESAVVSGNNNNNTNLATSVAPTRHTYARMIRDTLRTYLELKKLLGPTKNYSWASYKSYDPMIQLKGRIEEWSPDQPMPSSEEEGQMDVEGGGEKKPLGESKTIKRHLRLRFLAMLHALYRGQSEFTHHREMGGDDDGGQFRLTISLEGGVIEPRTGKRFKRLTVSAIRKKIVAHIVNLTKTRRLQQIQQFIDDYATTIGPRDAKSLDEQGPTEVVRLQRLYRLLRKLLPDLVTEEDVAAAKPLDELFVAKRYPIDTGYPNDVNCKERKFVVNLLGETHHRNDLIGFVIFKRSRLDDPEYRQRIVVIGTRYFTLQDFQSAFLVAGGADIPRLVVPVPVPAPNEANKQDGPVVAYLPQSPVLSILPPYESKRLFGVPSAKNFVVVALADEELITIPALHTMDPFRRRPVPIVTFTVPQQRPVNPIPVPVPAPQQQQQEVVKEKKRKPSIEDIKEDKIKKMSGVLFLNLRVRTTPAAFVSGFKAAENLYKDLQEILGTESKKKTDEFLTSLAAEYYSDTTRGQTESVEMITLSLRNKSTNKSQKTGALLDLQPLAFQRDQDMRPVIEIALSAGTWAGFPRHWAASKHTVLALRDTQTVGDLLNEVRGWAAENAKSADVTLEAIHMTDFAPTEEDLGKQLAEFSLPTTGLFIRLWNGMSD